MVPLLPIALAGVFLWVGNKRNVADPTTYPSGLVGGTSGYGALSLADMQLAQYELAWLGYYRGRVHGHYDDPTREALIHFQDDHGLIPDGEPGRQTWDVLDLVSAAAP
jgi:peptidoglycan hydrolase-like protein with peptidoglycan-binding domain